MINKISIGQIIQFIHKHSLIAFPICGFVQLKYLQALLEF